MTRQLSYEIITKQIGQPAVPIRFVHAACATCGQVKEFSQRSFHNPHHISNHFKELGWEFDKYRKAKIRCPDCQKTRTETLTSESFPELKTFGQRFRYLREHAHLKLDEVADEAQFDRRMLAHLESGEEHPFRIDQGSIARLLGVLLNHHVPVDRAWLLDLPQQGQTLATNIYNAMTKLNYVEVTLANAARIPVSQLKLMLSGTIATHYKLPEVAKVLGTTAEELMGLPPKNQKLEKPEPVEMVVLSPHLRTARLKEARQAKNLTQAELADLIHKQNESFSTTGTLIWMLSRIERGENAGPRADDFLKLAATFLDVPPDWLLGRTDDPVNLPLEAQIGVSENEMIEIIQKITRAESDLAGLNQLIDEAVQPLRQMVEEGQNTIDQLKTRISQFNLPQRIMAMLPQTAPAPKVDPVPLASVQQVQPERLASVQQVQPEPRRKAEPRPEPKQPESTPRPKPMVVAQAATVNGHANGIAMNGHKHFVNGRTPVGMGVIDRNSNSKQNTFAQAVKRIRVKKFNLKVIEEKIGPVIDNLVPHGSKRDAYVRAIIQREVAAPNGVLAKTDDMRGYWQLR